MTDYHFGQFTPEHLKKIRKGIELFNAQKYWECHEELEDLWMEDRNDPARNVYWAVIQVAAAMIHYREKNIIGAQGLINKAKEKFRRCESLKIETDLLFQYLDWDEIKTLTLAIADTDAALEDFKQLFEFRFKHFHE